MQVLVFRHVPFEHLGLIAQALAAHDLEWEYVDLYESDRVPPLADAAGLIIMGGPMSANDDLPYIRQEIEIIRASIAMGKPILGVCLGAQLIARALGARVYSNRVKEIGWAPVSWTPWVANDPLFAGLDAPEVLFHWHGETFDLPLGGVLLASSEACRNQAFRWGSHVHGLQFHLEVTPEMIADWCAQDANCGDMRELSEPIDPRANAARLAELSALVFGRWARLVREAYGRS